MENSRFLLAIILMAQQRSAPPPPSHAAFILAQVRSGLAHLRASGALDTAVFERVDGTLSRTVLQDHPQKEENSETVLLRDSSEDTLGKRNAWLRETLADTSLLPAIVEAALTIGVPSAFLGDTQKDAIVELVERSQKSIAQAVTDPKQQHRAQSGALSSAKGAQRGIQRGWHAAGSSLQDLAQKRQVAKQRSEEKRMKKEEEKELKQELKREREEFSRNRNVKVGSNTHRTPPTSQELSTSQPLQRITNESTSSGTQTFSKSHMLSNSQSQEFTTEDEAQSGLDTVEEDGKGAMASVSCSRLTDDENCVTATTMFSPWPGLLLSSTIVAVSDGPPASDEQGCQKQTGENDVAHTTLPPPRRVAPGPSITSPDSTTEVPSSQKIVASSPPSSQSQIPTTHQSPSISCNTSETYDSRLSARHHSAQTTNSSSRNFAPSPLSSPTSQPHSEVHDVTEHKQKTWTRRLGL